MKILTVKQPWASLIIHGGKDIENRQWWTGVRGRIGIHSSAKLETAECEDAIALLRAIHGKDAELPLVGRECGCIIGTIEIVDCVRQSDSPWFMGEYGFVLRNPIALPEPIKVRGQLGWWDYPLDAGERGGPHAD